MKRADYGFHGGKAIRRPSTPASNTGNPVIAPTLPAVQPYTVGQRFAECARLAAETTPEQAEAARRQWEAMGMRN